MVEDGQPAQVTRPERAHRSPLLVPPRRGQEGDDSFGDPILPPWPARLGLIVNEIGPYTGTTRLYVDVDGVSWNIEVQVLKRP